MYYKAKECVSIAKEIIAIHIFCKRINFILFGVYTCPYTVRAMIKITYHERQKMQAS